MDQDVFVKELNGALASIAAILPIKDRTVRLINSHETDVIIPLANSQNFAAAVRGVAAVMDKNNDVLVLVMTSHGERTGFALQLPGNRMTEFTPQQVASTLDSEGVKNRVVIVSACYSGIFIPLADADTMVITAADANHPSFGCRDRAQWTYFGDAFFNTAMRRAMTLKEAFNEARGIVRRRELRNGFDPSNPQMAGGESIEPALVSAAPPSRPPSKGRQPGLDREISAPGVRP